LLKIKRAFGSIYARFLFALIGAFLITMLIPVVGMFFIQGPNIENNITKMTGEKATNLKQLVYRYNFSVEQAIDILKTDEFDIETYASLNKTNIVLTDNQVALAEKGKIITLLPEKKNITWFSVLKIGETWICIHPNSKNNMLSLFKNIQLYTVAVPIILGTALIFLAAIDVAKPIKKLSIASKHVADGDLTVQIPPKGIGELRELIDNFNHMVQKLSENEYLHKEFASNVSHEFNTPITSLKGYAKLLKRKLLTDEKRDEYADIIIYETDRLSRLSSNLLRLSELENKGKIIIRDKFALDEQLREAVVLLQSIWEDKNIDINLDLDEIKISGDKALLYQVWINIIFNAIKYSNIGGSIHIRLIQNNGVYVIILDNGIGMSQEELGKVFLRFYKADKSRNTAGSGLGLSIAKKIVELHGGEINVESQEKSGTTFTVFLPKMKT
jgi:signal transduction histidine kinase